MKKYVALSTTALVLALALSLSIVCQAQGTSGQTGTAQQDPAVQERADYDAYVAFYNAYQAKDYEKALKLGNDYLAKFPSGKYVSQTKDSIPKLEYLVAAGQYNAAIAAKDTNKALELGKKLDTMSPNNFNLNYQLLTLAAEGGADKADLTKSYAEKLRGMIESGAKPENMDDATWKAQKGTFLAYTYTINAQYAKRNKQDDEALGYYEKAAQANPSVADYYLQIGQIHSAKYETAIDAYNKIPDDQKDSDAGKAAKAKAKSEADITIDNFAHYLALTDGKADSVRDQLQGYLAKVYPIWYETTPNGWQEIVTKYKSGGPATPK